ncbi:MAG TPA: hypothetical protein VLG76_08010 [Rhabdochlamydiaceae bacterium]|nr:hypothetical protein [Rhabdochlamydiaceae bacterium]HSX38648.1 hypothetical protein [Chlamydiales bacterium]
MATSAIGSYPMSVSGPATTFHFGAAQLAKTVASLAIPAFGLRAFSNIPQAGAAPKGLDDSTKKCIDCMNSCDKMEFALFQIACYAFCTFKVC